MNIIEKRLEELTQYENNPRNNEYAVEGVANSIREFGFKVPIVIDKNNVIVSGHTRYLACKELGIETVPCIVADDLTDEQIKAFRLADNKVSEVALWDFDKLNMELAEIEIDMTDFGFSEPLEFEELDLPDEAPEDTRGYNIMYEIAFNNEQEQEDWYKFLRELKTIYNKDTISERILEAVKEWRNFKKL